MAQELHLVVEVWGGLWHAIRHPDGHWTRFGDVRAVTGLQGQVGWSACAGIGGELHVLAVTSTGLVHAIRRADGSWTKFGSVNAATRYTGNLSTPACAAIGTDLHVCASTQARIFHSIRYGNGSWTGFGDVAGQAGPSGAVNFKLGLCGLAGELHVFAVAWDLNGPYPVGALLHTIRHTNGSWTPWQNLSNVIANAPTRISSVTASAVGSEIQIAVTDDAMPPTIHHALRRANGTWTAFGDVNRQTGDRGAPFMVGVAPVQNELQLGVTTGGTPNLWHTIRHADGSWQSFGDVSAATQRPGNDFFSDVHLAGVEQPPPPGPAPGPGGTTCYPGTPGASSVSIQNATGDDTLSIWQLDMATGVPSLKDTIHPGEVTTVDLTDCHFSQLIGVSHAWVASYNATFGTAYDPGQWFTAQTVNFQRWIATVLGRTSGPLVNAAVF